jgi:triacylglycerol lipase
MNDNPIKNPVLLVHGIYDTTKVFHKMAAYLTNLGWQVHSINLSPNNGSAKLAVLAKQIVTYIENNFAPEVSIDLIGFSMGGLVTRYYLQRLQGTRKVRRYINISAPNRGTLTAYALKLDGVLDMRPKSKFLRDLNSDVKEVLATINCTFLWTPFDLMILPAHSTKLSSGKEIKIPVLRHDLMLTDDRVLVAVTKALSQPIKL